MCREFYWKPYNYPKTASLTKLQLVDTQLFSVTGADNFGPVYVRNKFNKNDSELRKVWVKVKLYTCVSTRNIILDVCSEFIVSESFVRSSTRFISSCGCPDNIISENGKRFISKSF